jgi:3-oxoacyl-[acyl-carrier protein] reductase
MKRAGKGRIVTISSRAAIAPSLTGIQAYASAKHGQLGLVRSLRPSSGRSASR